MIKRRAAASVPTKKNTTWYTISLRGGRGTEGGPGGGAGLAPPARSVFRLCCSSVAVEGEGGSGKAGGWSYVGLHGFPRKRFVGREGGNAAFVRLFSLEAFFYFFEGRWINLWQASVREGWGGGR